MTSQCLSIQSVAPSAAFWLKTKGGLLRSSILGVSGVLERWHLYQSKSHPDDFQTPINTTFCYLPPFGRNSNANSYAPSPLSAPFAGLGGPKGSKCYQSKCRSLIPIRLLYTVQTYLAPFGHDTQRGRQTGDRQSDIASANYKQCDPLSPGKRLTSLQAMC